MDKRGFTLIEVVVAVAVLSIAMVLIVSLFSGGLSSVRLTRSYSSALVLAREKMDEAFSTEIDFDAEGAETGVFKRFRWERVLEPFYISDADDQETSLYRVRVRVLWKEGRKEKEISLEGILPPVEEGEVVEDAV